MSDIKYVAFDVHQATISAALLNLEGKLLTQAVMQTDATAIRDFLRGLSGVVHLTFEEGIQAQWLFELTPPLVSELLVCNPRLNHSHKRHNKSDRLNAFNLVRDLRAGLLKSVYHGSPQTQTLKQLVHIGFAPSGSYGHTVGLPLSRGRQSITRWSARSWSADTRARRRAG